MNGNYETDESSHTYIDYFAIEDDSADHFIFGTMRSSDVANPGNGMHIWRIENTCNHHSSGWSSGIWPCTNPTKFFVKKIDAGAESYVTGIRKKLEINY